MLVLYLFQALPQFLPRTTIEFKCRLGETQVRGQGASQAFQGLEGSGQCR